MVTIAGRLNRSWFGKLLWIFAFVAALAVAVVVIKFVASDATAQTSTAAVPAAQAVPPAAQTLQLTPAQRTRIVNAIAYAKPLSNPTEESLYQFKRSMRKGGAELKISPQGNITIDSKGVARVRIHVEAIDITKESNPARVVVRQKDVTLYFTLDDQKNVKAITGVTLH